jgi:hypothetical protein
MYTKMTHEEHVNSGIAVYNVSKELDRIYYEYQKVFGKNHKILRRLRTTIVKFNEARIEFDREYHNVTNEDQFRACGHIYYNGDAVIVKNVNRI